MYSVPKLCRIELLLCLYVRVQGHLVFQIYLTSVDYTVIKCSIIPLELLNSAGKVVLVYSIKFGYYLDALIAI